LLSSGSAGRTEFGHHAAAGLAPSALARLLARRPEVVAVALERRGLDAVDVLDVVQPVGGDLVEGDAGRGGSAATSFSRASIKRRSSTIAALSNRS
jgi:hypothetical protein